MISNLPQTIQGVLAMLVVIFCGAFVVIIIRTLSADMHVYQLVFFYEFIALLFFLPYLLTKTREELKPRKLPYHAIRAVLVFGAFAALFYAASLIPLSAHTALSFTVPLWATLFAVLFLKEHATWRTVLALAIGFAGILIIVRPGEEALSVGSLFVLGGSLMIGCIGPIIRYVSHTETPTRIVLYMLSLTSLVSLPFALAHWSTPTPEQWVLLAVLGALSLAQQVFISIAYSKATVTVLMPYNFVSLLLVSALAYWFFGEVITHWTVLGAAVILGASIYNTVYARRIQHIARETEIG